jgi:hypothetical protein
MTKRFKVHGTRYTVFKADVSGFFFVAFPVHPAPCAYYRQGALHLAVFDQPA